MFRKLKIYKNNRYFSGISTFNLFCIFPSTRVVLKSSARQANSQPRRGSDSKFVTLLRQRHKFAVGISTFVSAFVTVPSSTRTNDAM